MGIRSIIIIATGGGRYPHVSESVLLAILCNAPFLAINPFSIHRIQPFYRLNVFLFKVFVENAVSFCALTKKPPFCLIVIDPVKKKKQWY